MPNMYAGKILRIDLSTGKISTIPTEKYAKDFLGGRGVSVKILYDEVGPEVDPLSPDNLLIFDTGPFTGTAMPGSGRSYITFRSPVTYRVGSSSAGGYFAPEVKWAGYDHIVIKGKAPSPVYIAIKDGDVQIKDASHMWGLDCYDTPKVLRQEAGDPETRWACIGPAGENLVSFASIQTGTGNGATRNGGGTVMGSKNLKAIAVRGTGSVKVAAPEKYLEMSQWAMELLSKHCAAYEHMSHTGVLGVMDSLGRAGGYFFGNGPDTFDQHYSDEYSMQKWWRENGYQEIGCFNCPARCMQSYRIPTIGDGVNSCEKVTDMINHLAMSDFHAVYKLDLMQAMLGMDSHSLGHVMGWATALYQKGLITDEQVDCTPLEYGNGATYIELADKIAHRRGLGDVLADNLDVAAKRLGGENWEKLYYYTIQTKGHAHFMFAMQTVVGVALATAVSERGDFTKGQPSPELGPMEQTPESGFTEEEFRATLEYATKQSKRIAGTPKGAFNLEYEGKEGIVAYYEDSQAITDLTLTCKFLSEWMDLNMTPDVQAKVLSAGLGREVTTRDLFEYAWRNRSLERAYDVRMGNTRADDTVPERFFEEAISEGKYKGRTLDREKFEALKDRYYDLRGWDRATAAPTRVTLEDLGLTDVADDLEARGVLPGAKAERTILEPSVV